MITVRELITLLLNCDMDDVVILVTDSGGEPDSSPLDEVSAEKYIAETTYSGNVHIRELTDELIGRGFTEEDVKPDGVNCVALWPIN